MRAANDEGALPGEEAREGHDDPHDHEGGPDDAPEHAEAMAPSAHEAPIAEHTVARHEEAPPSAYEAAPVAVSRPSEPARRIPSIEPVSPPVVLETIADVAPTAAPEPAPVVAEPKPVEIRVESSHEDSSRPMRKGWWQRRFSAE